jgi:hypothetical protein
LRDKLFPDEDTKDELDLENKNVFVFGLTEPQMIEGLGMKHIPVLVAVVGSIAPPSKIGIKSVQMEKEEILDMGDLKMSWIPYIPKENRQQTLTKKNIPNIYFLHCSQRRESLKRMKEQDIVRYTYALPYFMKPSKYMAELDDEGTEVTFVWAPTKAGAHTLTFDWECDDRNDWVEEVCKNHELDYNKYKDALMKELKENVLAEKDARKKKREERQKEVDAIPDFEKEALENMKFYKFYPQKPDVRSVESRFINRYIGSATQTFPEPVQATTHFFTN